MGSNKLVMLGVAVLAVIVIAVIVNAFNRPEAKTTMAAAENVVPTPDPDKPIVGDGDTVSETLKQVQAKYTESQDSQKDMADKVGELEDELRRLKQKRFSNTSGDSETDPIVEQFKTTMRSMKGDIELLTNQLLAQRRQSTATENGYRVSYEDLGLDGQPVDDDETAGAVNTLPGYTRVAPMTRSGSLGASKIQSFIEKTDAKKKASVIKNTMRNKVDALDKRKVFTIPARSTLFEGVAMTALIGTVPVGGKVTDPFPAKFIVGDTNLATNGLRIPGLKGIVFEGIARGNWNLSCVSVEITGGTYTFQDGRIQHLKMSGESLSGSEYKASSPYSGNEGNQSIGYITNRQGIPCIPGKRVTDAHRQLASMGLLGAGATYFDAKAAAETTTSSSTLGNDTSVTGDKVRFINNTMYGDSLRMMMQFYEQRMGDSFDAIYIDPGALVSFNPTQDLHIDYDNKARKLAYRNGGSYAYQLD